MTSRAECEGRVERERPMLKSNLYMVRHGQSTANLTGELYEDPPLTEEGLSQAQRAGKELREVLANEPTAIVHTGLIRSLRTAGIIRGSAGFTSPLVEMPAFREREMGVYGRMTLIGLLEREPHLQDLFQQYGPSCVWFIDGNKVNGVEPLCAMQTRIREGVGQLQQQYGDLPVVVVGHAGSIKMSRMMYECPEMDMKAYLSSYVPANCEITGLGTEGR